MLNRNQFEVLNCYRAEDIPTQRRIVRETGLSLGTVNATVAELIEKSFIEEEGGITDAGREALIPHKVDNAIIMAAGMSSRFAPLSYEQPKGILRVSGEVLVERQIRQLQEAGISNIVVVVGYMKEKFFYLEDEMKIDIVINEAYRERNNNSSIKCVEHRLANSYVCCSDNWFEENPFKPYVYDSYYSASYENGPTDEWCIKTQGKDKRIVDVIVGGEDCWAMRGHVYWSRAFSDAFVNILNEVYNHPTTASKLWEQIYLEHIETLPPLYMKKYETGVIWEFDSLAELCLFDPEFISNVDSNILNNICTTFDCERKDIKNLIPLKIGITNLSFSFDLDEKTYVYRHPEPGEEEIINHYSETASQKIAQRLGIDTTFIFENPDEGWKISHFIENTIPFDYHNEDHVLEAMRIARLLHSCGEDTGFHFNLHEETLKQVELLDENHRTSFKDFESISGAVKSLNDAVMSEGLELVLSHNNFYDQSFLVSADRMDLIDWEYSSMSDYASDLAVFICCCPDYTLEDALHIFELYFGRPMSHAETFHCLAYSAVVAFHWFVWSLYKDVRGRPIGESLYYYYRYTKMFIDAAQKM